MTITKKKPADRQPAAFRFVLLDFDERWRDRFGRGQTFRCADARSIPLAAERATSDSLWISSASGMTEKLLASVAVLAAQQHGRRNTFGDLLMLEPPRTSMLPSLHGCFRRVIGEVPSFKTLPLDQLAEVLLSDDRANAFIGGAIDRQSNTLALVRGNLETITAPLSIFGPSGATKPDFRKFALDDYGQTVRFGDYEASADAVLYEFDPDYRTRINARRHEREKGFGASLRRLRKQRGLSRDDFRGLSEKTIARLERGEVERPQGKTLNIIAKTLNVTPDEIETY